MYKQTGETRLDLEWEAPVGVKLSQYFVHIAYQWFSGDKTTKSGAQVTILTLSIIYIHTVTNQTQEGSSDVSTAENLLKCCLFQFRESLE